MGQLLDLGELKRRKPRDIWPDEAKDFTPWLAQHIAQLGEALGMDLELTAKETAVGGFCCDLLAKDLSTDRIVVIENQFGSTDHDHLGKALTYAAGLDARAIVWIAEKTRDEHRQTLEWLNAHTDDDTEFYAVVVEVVQIDASRPAVVFKPVVFPNDWRKETRHRTEGAPVTTRGEAYRRFFQQLIDELREQHKFTNSRKAQPYNWQSFSIGYTGIVTSASFALGDRVRTEIYIDRGDFEENKRIFDALYARKCELEAAFGESLSWERLDDKQASRVALYRTGNIEAQEQQLQQIHQWIVKSLLKFKQVFSPAVSAVLGTDRQ